jgi:Mg/Co/Ni transporter MgtE
MILGNEPQYVENDPTAPTKMQYVQDIMSKNPVAQQQSQTNQTFQMIFQNYVKNLQMSIMQQQNKQIGRIGVTPVADKLQQEAAMGGVQQTQEMQPQQPLNGQV